MAFIQSSVLNPFNHFGAVKIMPSWMGFAPLNAGPKALANKADRKSRQIRDKEADLLVARMSEDAKSGKYFNVYQIHGASWGRVENFLKRKNFLYMYDEGTANKPFQMNVAVSWLHESKWTANGNDKYFEFALAHFLGECIAAGCCNKVGRNFPKVLCETIYKKFINKNQPAAAKATQEVNKMSDIIFHTMGVAMEMCKHPKENAPLMNVSITGGDLARVARTATDIMVEIARNYKNQSPSAMAGMLIANIAHSLPAQVAKMNDDERRRRIAERNEQALAIAFTNNTP